LQKKLAANITEEQGKTLADAEGDVLRGLQVGMWLNLESQNAGCGTFVFAQLVAVGRDNAGD
jgi:hypothetical protein